MSHLSIFAAALPEVSQLVALCCCWLVACRVLCYHPALSELGTSQGLLHTQSVAVVALASDSVQPCLGCVKDIVLWGGAVCSYRLLQVHDWVGM